jgi:hypothetical protein
MPFKRNALGVFIFVGGLFVADTIYTSGKNFQKNAYRDKYNQQSKDMTAEQKDSLLQVMQADYRAASSRYRNPE